MCKIKLSADSTFTVTNWRGGIWVFMKIFAKDHVDSMVVVVCTPRNNFVFGVWITHRFEIIVYKKLTRLFIIIDMLKTVVKNFLISTVSHKGFVCLSITQLLAS